MAFVPFPIFLRLSHKALTIVRGDSTDEHAVERALSDVEAGITVLGLDAGLVSPAVVVWHVLFRIVRLFEGSARAPVTPASASDGHDRLRLATIVVQ